MTHFSRFLTSVSKFKIIPSWSFFNLLRNVLDRKDRHKIYFVTFIQVLLSVLDLVSVALIGLLSAITVNGIQSKKPSGSVYYLIDFFRMQNLPLQQQVAFIGIVSGLLLILRIIFALWFTKKLLMFLNLRGAIFSTQIISQLLKQPLIFIQQKSVQETIFLVTVGVGAITNGVIATSVSVVADLALLIAMIVGLFFVNPIISFLTIMGFGITGFALYQIFKFRASKLAVLDADLTIKTHQKLEEVLISYRESIVRDRREYYSNLISTYRFKMAKSQAEAMFIPTISKYVVEITFIIAALVLAAVQFLLFDSVHAITTLTIFLAAGSRVAPAIIRMHQGALQIRTNFSVALKTLELWERISNSNEVDFMLVKNSKEFSNSQFVPEVILNNISFFYPGKLKPSLSNINLKIIPGEMVAIVGSSGAGKTTLVDIILGVISPTQGQALISGTSPEIALKIYKGSISYVPQDILIIDGSVKENVALGFQENEIDDSMIWEALRSAQLEDFVNNLPNGLNYLISERGNNLSGGQRQRLGLARALLTKPKILVLDEATSALDHQTEANITEMLLGLKGSMTLIIIAHRLSTIRDVERIVYLENGMIVSEGTFKKVESEIPGFREKSIS